MAVDVIKSSNNEIQGIVTESKSGRQAILARRVIDCTGDADVAYLSGCPFTMLKKDERMGCTQVFNASGVEKVSGSRSAVSGGASPSSPQCS